MELKYWKEKKKQRGYQRLDDSSSSTTTNKKKLKRVKLDPTRKKRFSWKRFKIVPKLRILSKTTSPKKVLTWLRDAYVNMMLRLANSRYIGSTYGYGDGYGYGSGLVKREYDEKKLVEIYKSVLMVQGNMVHRDVPNLSSGSSIVLSPIR